MYWTIDNRRATELKLMPFHTDVSLPSRIYQPAPCMDSSTAVSLSSEAPLCSFISDGRDGVGSAAERSSGSSPVVQAYQKASRDAPVGIQNSQTI